MRPGGLGALLSQRRGVPRHLMAIEYFYTQNGQAAPVPVSGDQLRQMAASGQLVPTDMIWKEGMPTWLPASSLKGLFSGTKPLSGEMASAAVPNFIDKVAAAKAARASNPRQPALVTPTSPAVPPAPSGLSPYLVLALTLVSGGLFGLVFAAVRGGDASGRTARAAGRFVGQTRPPVHVGLWSYFSLGLYFAWWAHVVLKECAGYLDRRDVNARGELALMFAFPPYLIYVVAFRLPALVQQVRDKAGLPAAIGLSQGALFACPLWLPALPLLGMAIQEALNEVWTAA